MHLFQKYSRFILPVFITGFLIFLVFSLFSGLKKKEFKGFLDDVAKQAEVTIKDLSFVQTETGALSWALKAEGAVLSEAGGKTLLENVSITLPYGDTSELYLEGDEGLVDTTKKAFSIRKKSGLMTVDLGNGFTIKTQGFIWNESHREIVSEGRAFIYGSQINIDGDVLRVDVDTQEMTIIGDVKALVY